MPPADLIAWRKHMGFGQRPAAAALGVALNTYQEWERGARFRDGSPAPIDLRTALACSALAAGLEPWTAAPTRD